MQLPDTLAKSEHSRLREALALSRLDEARALIAKAKERGVSLLDLQTYRGSSVLLRTFACHPAVFCFLLDEGATFVKEPVEPGSELQMFSEYLLELEIQVPAIKALVTRYGLDQVKVVFSSGWTFTHSAALNQNLTALRYLHEIWPESFSMRDQVGDTPGELVAKILSTRTGRLPAKQVALRTFFASVHQQPDELDIADMPGAQHDQAF